MLGKLLKYEVKSTARIFLPLYAVLLAFAGINRLLQLVSSSPEQLSFSSITYGISMFIYILLIAGVLVMTLIMMIQRFYKNLLGDEGYLMFTLPVATMSHIISKLLIAMLWTFLSSIVAGLSIFIISYQHTCSLDAIRTGLSIASDFIRQYLGAAGFFEIPLIILVSTAANITLVYAAMALGHLFNKHKLLASFGMYIGLTTLMQIIMTFITSLFAGRLFSSMSAVPTQSQLQLIMVLLLLFSAFIFAACLALTQILLSKKLNLE